MRTVMQVSLLGPREHAGTEPDQLDMTLTDIGPYLKAYAESRAKLQAAPAAPMALFEGPYGPDVVGVRLGMTLDEAQSDIGRHMKVAGTFRIAGASSGWRPRGSAGIWSSFRIGEQRRSHRRLRRPASG